MERDATNGNMKMRARLYAEALQGVGATVTLIDKAHHYLRNVLRATPGEAVELFNGQQGGWRAEIVVLDKKRAELVLHEQTAPPARLPDIWVVFAPVKKDRLDYMAQKATEMGACRLLPVQTARTQGQRMKDADKLHANLRANAIEAAEQCGLNGIPEIVPLQTLDALLADWTATAPGRRLLFCDEAAAAETGHMEFAEINRGARAALLIGPEGGFTPAEADAIRAHTATRSVSLGPRILRADTALVAALALAQSHFGDWSDLPIGNSA